MKCMNQCECGRHTHATQCPACGKVLLAELPALIGRECEHCGSVGCGCPKPRRTRRRYAES